MARMALADSQFIEMKSKVLDRGSTRMLHVAE